MAGLVLNFESLSKLSTLNEEFSHGLKPLLSKQLWSSNDRNLLLNKIAKALLHSDKTTVLMVAEILGPLIHDILHRLKKYVEVVIKNRHNEPQPDATLECKLHAQVFSVLGQLCELELPGIESFVFEFLKITLPDLHRLIVDDVDCSESPAKKRKILSSTMFDDFMYGVLQVIRTVPRVLTFTWPWKYICEYVANHKDDMNYLGRWSFSSIIAILLNLRCGELKKLESASGENNKVWQISYNGLLNQLCFWSEKERDSHSKIGILDSSLYTMKTVSTSDLVSDLISVCGVILPKINTNLTAIQPDYKSRIVIQTAFEKYLHSVALAISHCHPVMLEGPPGCGKSTLVEYLAHVTGRSNSDFIKVQLGEGIDSKVLSGTYKCTAVSGVFEWQPGALSQAVQNGSWILLEDVDKAPLDVASLLLPLLERGQLKVAGQYSDTDDQNVLRSSGFRIFLTCRTGAVNMDANSIVAMLKRHCRFIKMESIGEEDLKTMINAKYPKIQHLTSKILEIYSKLEDLYMEVCGWDSRTNKRISSVRDLFRLCRRIATRIHKGLCESELGRLVAMETVDCLVASSMKETERASKIHSAYTLLNLSTANAEYYCQSYKPEIQIQPASATFGRVCLPRSGCKNAVKVSQQFAFTRSSSILLEKVACAIEMCEPVLLVGETGVGKTSVVQYLAEQLGSHLHVVNISQQSSSSDLLGSFKPVQPKLLIAPARDCFESLFCQTFSQKQNEKFLSHIQVCFLNKRYDDLLRLMCHCTTKAINKLLRECQNADASDKDSVLEDWKTLDASLIDIKQQIKVQQSVAFTFVEGVLSQAIKKGDWILLDEINLASPETLDCLNSIIESEDGSVSLLEIGDSRPLKRHPNFRIFAAMNPATDVGKRNLPVSIRNRFLELFVPEPNDDADLCTIISHYLRGRNVIDNAIVNGILTFYRQACELSSKNALSNVSQRSRFSLRSLCRALRYVIDNPKMSLLRALYEGLCLAFLTEIDHSEHEAVIQLIIKCVIGKNKVKSVVKHLLPSPSYKHVTVAGYHIRGGDLEPFIDPKYIITPYVEKNLKVLARGVSYGKYPILIEGETSTGKTSIIQYLASQTGNTVIRINNHEHTDLQEYIGSYTSDENGNFYFQEGPLVTAMRHGNWIILDELNLAPTDILESLNRVLDDNRELFIPETQEVVTAHPRFTLFATQNPPGVYGGRKVLSRALRNRFIELHFGEIPSEEIKTILHLRCDLPMSRCNKLVKIMHELQERRRTSGIFAGKQGFITLRDLFRWAERYRQHHADTDSLGTYDWDQQLADDGYLLLAGRVRKSEEKVVVQETIRKHLGKTIDPEQLFSEKAVLKLLGGSLPTEFDHIVLTKPLRKILVMMQRALCFDEPVLLVGETGCGKTTVCQLLSALRSFGKSDLFTINCHSHSDASDFLGGLRPVRHASNTEDTATQSTKLFEWVDGPLVQAMSLGKCILIDEISLAEDSVLERLNSVLETSRILVVPDRVNSDNASTSVIKATNGFQFMATMNPGGDFGKKELSPALRNRLTEIWCTTANDNDDDVKQIVCHNLKLTTPLPEVFAEIMVDFMKWFSVTTFGARYNKSIRDIIKWINFCNVCTKNVNALHPVIAFVHGALLVFIDGIGSGLSDSLALLSKDARAACVSELYKQLSNSKLTGFMNQECDEHLKKMIVNSGSYTMVIGEKFLSMDPFCLKLCPTSNLNTVEYNFSAPTTSVNTFRLLRALQLPNPILLEGSPGIGKTSLVIALAKASGHDIVRINLSEQTDMSDLLGADLPVDEGIGGQFSWRDGPLLSALKKGAWVVFDELNLASQSILEGLNSVFDHRGEIFIPEIGCTFHIKVDETRIFACQNPYYQGGGRKGLPKSFLNRFNQVYMNSLSRLDLILIIKSQFPNLPEEMVVKIIKFNEIVQDQVVNKHQWAHLGAPWEFNLRDIVRWCELISKDETPQPEKYVYLIYCERLQTAKDREKMYSLFEDVFLKSPYQPSHSFHFSSEILQVGNAVMRRNGIISCQVPNALILPSMLHSMEALMTTIQQGWMCILSGRSGAGKTTLVESLASLTGNKLKIFSVNSNMDATELLGGFEQMDFRRHLSALMQELSNLIKENCETTHKELLDISSGVVAHDLESLQIIEQAKRKILGSNDIESAISQVKEFEFILESLESKHKEKDPIVLGLKECHSKLQRVLGKMKNAKGRFEWIDSELVEALRQGDWLMIDGASLCNPSVLDRLNALLEPNGVLSVTERGVINGSFIEIKPHPSFRLILSVNTSEGNLSRAMRNRGVEIHLLSSQYKITESYLCHGGMTWDEILKIVQSILTKTKAHSFAPALLGYFKKTSGNGKVSEHEAMVNCVKFSEEIYEEFKSGRDVVSCLETVCSRYLVKNESDIDMLQEFKDFSINTIDQSPFNIPHVNLKGILHNTNASMALYQAQIFDVIQSNSASTPQGDLELFDVACTLFLHMASTNDHLIRLQFLSDYGHKIGKLFLRGDDQQLNIEILIEKYTKSVQIVLSSDIYKNIDVLKNEVETDEMPWDPRWSQQLMKVLPLELSSSCSCQLNTLFMLFTANLKHMEDDAKLNSILKPLMERSKSSSKRNRRRTNEGKDLGSLCDSGALSSSSLYHSGYIKLQHLSHPAIAYIFPLYQNIWTFLSEILQEEIAKLRDMKSLNETMKTLSELSLIWKSLMVPGKFDSTVFSLSIKRLQSCAQYFHKLTSDSASNESFAKIDKVFAVVNQLLEFDWAVVSMQSKIRLSICQEIVEAVPYQNENIPSLIDCSRRVLKILSDAQANGMAQSCYEHIIQICDGVSDLIIKNFSQIKIGFPDASENYDEVSHLCESLTCEIEKAEASVLEFQQLQSSSTTENPDENLMQTEEFNHLPSVLPMAHYVLVQKILNLLNFISSNNSDSLGYLETISNTVCSIHHFIMSLKITNTKVLLAVLHVFKFFTSDKLSETRNVIRQILPQLGNILVENNLIQAYGNNYLKCNTGNLILSKPYLTQAAIKAIYDELSNSDTIQRHGEVNFEKDLTSANVWTSLSFPLSNCPSKLKQLDSMQNMLWLNTRTTDLPMNDVDCSTTLCDTMLMQSATWFCNYFTCCLSSLNSTSCILEDIADQETLQLLSRIIAHLDDAKLSNQSTAMISFYKSMKSLEKEVKTFKERCNSISTSPSPTTWQQQLKYCLNGALKYMIGVIQGISTRSKMKTDFDLKQATALCWTFLGVAWSWTGIFAFLLYSPQSDIDPVVIYQFKSEKLRKHIQEIDNQLIVYSSYYKTLTGRSLCLKESSEHTHVDIHPIMLSRFKHLCDLKKKLVETSQKTAYRPSSSEFKDLSRQSMQFCNGTISSDRVASVFKPFEVFLDEHLQTKAFILPSFAESLIAMESMKKNISSFSASLEDYPAFPDFISPMQDSLNSVSLGLSILENMSEVLTNLRSSSESSLNPETFFVKLFSIQSDIELVPDKFISFVSGFQKCILNDTSNKENIICLTSMLEKVIVTLLLRYRNIALFEGASSPCVGYILQLLELVITDLNEQKEKDAAKQEEKLSIYKVKHHMDDVDEENENKIEFQTIFGTPDEIDMIETTQQKTIEEDRQHYTDSLRRIAIIVHSDVMQLAGAQVGILKLYTKKEKESNNIVQYTTHQILDLSLPSVYSHYALHQTFESAFAFMLNMDVDQALLNTNLCVVKQLKDCLQPLASDSLDNDTSKNVYTDSFVTEVIQCLPIMNDLLKHVSTSLLQEWPEHPTLLKISETVKRVLTFPATSPLIKFVHGLEILLGTVQEWEKNASSAVSLQSFMEEITSYVCKWRKMELSGWNKLLDDEFKKQKLLTPGIYFSLYQFVLCEYNETIVGDVISHLEQFIESSTLPQFHSRLNALHIFLQHLTITEKGRGTIANCLRNVHAYYSQFSEPVLARIEALRQPIEKELKDFVRIISWSDRNFFAVKESVEKTHQHLFRLIKKFSQAMKEKVQCKVFVQNSHTFSFVAESHTKSEDLGNGIVMDTDPSISVNKSAIDKYCNIDKTKFSLLHRLPSLWKKLRLVCAKYNKGNANLGNNISIMASFTVDIIDSANHLKALKPLTPVGKKGDEKAHAKRLAEAKNIKLRKQRALNDLFKHLATLGFSYKKGIIIGRTFSSQKFFVTPAISESDMLKKISVVFSGPGILNISIDSLTTKSARKDYFFPNITKWSALSLATSSPHKDLTRGNVERCQGFMAQLTRMSVQQREKLSSINVFMNKLFSAMSFMKNVSESKCCIFQSEAKLLMNESRRVIDQLCIQLQKLTMWMDCCPTSLEFNDPSDATQQGKGMVHGDKIWSLIMNQITAFNEEVITIKMFIDQGIANMKSEKFYMITHTWISNLNEKVMQVFSRCDSLSTHLTESFKSSSKNHLDSLPVIVVEICKLSKTLNSFHKKLHTHCVSESEQTQNLSNNADISKMMERLEATISVILIAMQNLSKGFEERVRDLEESCELQDDLFVKHTHNQLLSEIETMCLDNVFKELETLILFIMKAVSKMHREELENITSTVLPWLQEFYNILFGVQSTLNMLHHATGKLTYVLGGIFVQLLQNGFCTPPELEENEEEGDATEFENAEGGGVGEGEGCNDVSEQIEDEEMLEDKGEDAGDKSEDNQIENSDKAIEMSNDFDGEFNEEAQVENSDDEESDEKEEPDFEKQMGELGEEGVQDKLDEQFWGSDDEEDEEKDEKGEEEQGKGIEKSESELAAKDGDLNDEDKAEELEEETDKNKEDDKPCDESQFDPQEVDPYSNDDNKEQPKDNDLDMTEDLKVDEQELDENDVDEDMGEENIDVKNMDDAEEDPLEDGENLENPGEIGNEEDQEKESDSEEANYNDAQDALPAEEEDAKDIAANTISENISKDSNKDADHNDNAVSEMPTAECAEPQDFQNEGNAPSDGTWDDTQAQSSCVSQNKKELVDTKTSSRKRDPDTPDPNSERTQNEEIEKRLNVVDASENEIQDNDNEVEPSKMESDAYKHVKSPTSRYDKKTFDSVTEEEHQHMEVSNEEAQQYQENIDNLDDGDIMDEEITGEVMKPQDLLNDVGVEDFSLSEIHTDVSKTDYTQFLCRTEEETRNIREKLEKQLQEWRQNCDDVEMREAEMAWQNYCNLTAPLAIELCEQLRLVLAPSQASQLKGDYRTGKRLNIRKMIPYIASGFRKDKIWLRRTKPNKRVYQIMLAVDDSSSMVDNHSKQLAFESVAVISSALSSLEAGELAICSFGEQVQLLQNFGDTMSAKSGASLLARCSFQQKKTKIAEFLDYSVELLHSARRHSSNTNPNIAQLLLIISDGRGLYLEGRKRVLEAVNSINRSRIFVVFIILDQPNKSQGSISDIKVPVFNKPGEMPEIRSYMQDFPFPFYVIIRDVNVLPQTLGDALRQWFELVTESE